MTVSRSKWNVRCCGGRRKWSPQLDNDELSSPAPLPPTWELVLTHQPRFLMYTMYELLTALWCTVDNITTLYSTAVTYIIVQLNTVDFTHTI